MTLSIHHDPLACGGASHHGKSTTKVFPSHPAHIADSALECDVQQKDIYQPESGEMGLDAVRKSFVKLQASSFRSRPASVSGTKMWRARNHLTPNKCVRPNPASGRKALTRPRNAKCNRSRGSRGMRKVSR